VKLVKKFPHYSNALFPTSVKACFAEFFDASTRNGIIVTSEFSRCPKNENASILGRAIALGC